MYNVVIADDEPFILVGLNFLIGKTELPVRVVHQADSGTGVMEYIGENPVDIVITDIRMPGMSGLELAAQLHRGYSGTQCIILTGYDDFKYAQEAIRHSVKDFLLKPVKLNELKAALEKVISELATDLCIPPAQYERLAELLAAAVFRYEPGRDDAFFRYWRIIFEGIPADAGLKLWHSLVLDTAERIGQRYGYMAQDYIHHFPETAPQLTMAAVQSWIEALRSLVWEIEQNRIPVLFNNLRERLFEKYADDMLLGQFADELGYSTSYLSQQFKNVYGISFTKYRNRIRLEKAKELLLQSDASVTEVAASVGYNDISYFTRIFKQYTKETPRDFRKKRGACRRGRG